MAYPNTAPITSREKWWGLIVALVTFPVGLIALVGLLANQAWARWVGAVLGVVAGVGGALAIAFLLIVFLPEQGSSYPFGPWFVFLAALIALLGLLAARTFIAGLRSTETEA